MYVTMPSDWTSSRPILNLKYYKGNDFNIKFEVVIKSVSTLNF